MRRSPIIVNRNQRNRQSLGPVILGGIEYPVWDLDWFWRTVRTGEYSYTAHPDPKYTYSLTVNIINDADTEETE